MTIVRYGVIGASGIAASGHVPGAKATTNSRIVAIASRDLDKAKRFAAKHGIDRAYGSYDELLNDPEIDAVINTLPNSMHCEWTICAAKAGKHVLCEKPLAVSLDEARCMVQAANDAGIMLLEAYTHLFTGAMQSLRRHVASGTIGEPVAAFCTLTYPLTDWSNDSRAKTELGGGAMLDCGGYCVSALRYAIGHTVTGCKAYQHLHPVNRVDDTTSAILSFDSGLVATMLCSMRAPFVCRLEVWGTAGDVTLPNYFAAGSLVIRDKSGERTETFAGENRFGLQMSHFSACVLGEASLLVPPEDAVENARVTQSIRESCGRP